MLLKYVIAWFGMMILAIANGAVREFVYKPHMGELPAHQLSTFILLLIFTIYYWTLMSFWRIESGGQAWIIDGIWVMMTLLFEFGIGRFISCNSWSTLLHDYDLLAGRIWVFVPSWILIAPAVLFRIKQSH